MSRFSFIPTIRRLPLLAPRHLPRAIVLVMLLAGTVAILLAAIHADILKNPKQMQSLAIFCGVIWGILLYEDHRLGVGIIAVLFTIALRLYSSVDELISAAGLNVILFLLGTFLVAGYLEQSLFFEHVASQMMRRVGRRSWTLMAGLMLGAMISSAVVGEVAAILFVGGAMLHVTHRYKLQPIPFLMMLVFATNVGSAAGPFGPVSVMIALKAKLGVADFLRWATPISVVVLGLVVAICRWWFAKDWAALSRAMRREDFDTSVHDPSRKSPAAGWILVAAMLALFLFHTQIEQAIGIRENAVLLIAALAREWPD